MSTERQDQATLRDTIALLRREVTALRRRLAVLANCQDKRCSLCLNCLNATYDEDD